MGDIDNIVTVFHNVVFILCQRVKIIYFVCDNVVALSWFSSINHIRERSFNMPRGSWIFLRVKVFWPPRGGLKWGFLHPRGGGWSFFHVNNPNFQDTTPRHIKWPLPKMQSFDMPEGWRFFFTIKGGLKGFFKPPMGGGGSIYFKLPTKLSGPPPQHIKRPLPNAQNLLAIWINFIVHKVVRYYTPSPVYLVQSIGVANFIKKSITSPNIVWRLRIQISVGSSEVQPNYHTVHLAAKTGDKKY